MAKRGNTLIKVGLKTQKPLDMVEDTKTGGTQKTSKTKKKGK